MTGKVSVNAKARRTTILAKDEKTEIVEACQILALLDRGGKPDEM